ncbi:hypothetical protein CSW30_10400 [Thermus scotoductus]|uniref:Uncharacterized protein n=1 Tax=Thermus scotoductus TaxID=37636 RepID=A0A430UMM9_THESC|nr:hypothetical protein CSW30_10400 [Thermus scotoductus]
MAFLTLRHSSFRVRWSATVIDEGYNKKGYDILGQAIKEAILNKADPKSVLDKAQKLAEDLLSGKIR